MKKYKAFPPETTIANIRTTLHNLGLLLHESQDILKLLYGKELTREVFEDLDVPHKVLQYYSFPNCPDCKNCKLFKECRQQTIEAISEKVKTSSIEIDQIQTQFDLWNNAD